MEGIYVRMFGEFSLQVGDVQISDHNSRSTDTWQLLAYLLLNRKNVISKSELIRILWEDDAAKSNPENTLKVVLHRTRAMLNRLWPSAGHQLIRYKNGGYIWNSEVPVLLDVEEFERLSKKSCADDRERMHVLQDAVSLYRSEFLLKHSSAFWIMPLSVYYHNLYIKMVTELISIMSERGWHQEVISVCKTALQMEAHHEPLHRHLMKAMIALGDYKGSVSVYERMSRRMEEECGTKPEPETIALYQTALQTMRENHWTIEEIKGFLKEPYMEGALHCDYDYFKILCHAEARAMKRNELATHIALLTLEVQEGHMHSNAGLEHAVERLGEQIRHTLRQSDAYAQCSMMQYILLLPQASFENSQKICERIITGYHREHPKLYVKISFQVKQLVPVYAE